MLERRVHSLRSLSTIFAKLEVCSACVWEKTEPSSPLRARSSSSPSQDVPSCRVGPIFRTVEHRARRTMAEDSKEAHRPPRRRAHRHRHRHPRRRGRHLAVTRAHRRGKRRRISRVVQTDRTTSLANARARLRRAAIHASWVAVRWSLPIRPPRISSAPGVGARFGAKMLRIASSSVPAAGAPSIVMTRLNAPTTASEGAARFAAPKARASTRARRGVCRFPHKS